MNYFCVVNGLLNRWWKSCCAYIGNNAAGNVRGQADIALANALKLDDYPKINIHTYRFDAGENELKLEKGRVLILGFIPASQNIKSRDAGLIGKRAIDWLFQDPASKQ